MDQTSIYNKEERLANDVKQTSKEKRDSNFELFRIVSMLLIVSHHYVVNSGLLDRGGVVLSSPFSLKSIILLLLGAWGKTGINCFLLLSGYFMCKSNISLRKFVKLIGEVYFYRIIIYLAFLVIGYESISMKSLLLVLLPINQVKTNFTGCYLLFFLFIPYINMLIQTIDQRKHIILLALCGVTYIVFGTIHRVYMNYVSWFVVIYLIAAYIRLYPHKIFSEISIWSIATVLFIGIASLTVVIGTYLYYRFGMGMYYAFVVDSNSLLPVLVSVSAFLLFKNINIRYNKVINTVAASTFGVLCIHANSDAMRKWLWKDTLNNVGHYSILHAVISVTIVFIICTLIDILRKAYVEKPFFRVMDKKWNGIISSYKVLEKRIMQFIKYSD